MELGGVNMFAAIEQALENVKTGKFIIVVDDDNMESEGALVLPSELATKETVNFMARQGGGMVFVSLTEERLEELNLPQVEKSTANLPGMEFAFSVVHGETRKGISAEDRAFTIKKLVESGQTANNFRVPGHIIGVKAQKGGVLRKAGIAEAASDIALLSGLKPSCVICEILGDDGAVAKLPQILEFAEKNSIEIISIEDLIAYRRDKECYVIKEAEANLPTAYGNFKMVGFVNKLNGEHHVALVKGEIAEADEVLVRVHSECLTGDAFHSLKCDCGEQLAAALAAIEKEGKGILLYLRQEGRGIGLINKIKAYKLQEEGMDTEEANLVLGFPSDMRDYGIGAQILSELNVRKVRLMTNNPKKLVGIKGHGIEVIERVPLIMETNLHNEKYFSTKKQKMGHLY
jgi:3,4-dihydroxy 2-butanone 4-phosphate synthase / GTP cyclohydrolase II